MTDKSDIPDARLIMMTDDIGHSRTVYRQRKRVVLRRMVYAIAVTPLGIVGLWIYGQLVSMPSSIAEWPFLYVLAHIGVVSFMLLSVGIGALLATYCGWRASGAHSTEIHYLEYPDGSRKALSEQEAANFLCPHHHHDDSCDPQSESNNQNDDFGGM